MPGRSIAIFPLHGLGEMGFIPCETLVDHLDREPLQRGQADQERGGTSKGIVDGQPYKVCVYHEWCADLQDFCRNFCEVFMDRVTLHLI